MAKFESGSFITSRSYTKNGRSTFSFFLLNTHSLVHISEIIFKIHPILVYAKCVPAVHVHK